MHLSYFLLCIHILFILIKLFCFIVVNNEWKVLGEDNIGRIYVGWSATENKNIDIIKTCIGRFNPNVEAVQVTDCPFLLFQLFVFKLKAVGT